jgi:ankyrin repeat protein
LRQLAIGHVAVVRLFLTSRQDNSEINKANDEGFTPFYIASCNGHESIVEYGANVLQETTIGNTPLLYIASTHGHVSNGHTDVCLLLLSYGAIQS